MRVLMLIALVSVAAATDLKSRRIPNLLTFPVIVIGLSLWLFDMPWMFLSSLGATLLVLLLGMGLYMLGILGGGDGKLMAAVAAIMGARFLGEALLWTAIFGGIVALGLLAWKRALVPFFGRLFRAGYEFVVWRLPPGEVIEGEGHRIPYAVIVMGGVLLTLIAEWRGFTLLSLGD